MKRILFLWLLFPAALYAGQPPGLAKGSAADKIYDYSGIDSINTFNGNLTLQIPIGPSFSAGGGLSYALVLTYNSKVWDYEQAGTATRVLPSRRSNAGLGWMLTLGRMITDSSNDTEGPLYESPDGADHEFFDKLHESDPPAALSSGVTRLGYTRDGSYLRLIERSSTTEVESPNGIVRRFNTSSGDLLDIRDRSGNSVTVSTFTSAAGTPCLWNAPLVWAMTDSTGARTNYVCFEDSPDEPYYDRRIERVILAAPPDANGTARTATYQFVYATAPAIHRGCHSNYSPDPVYFESLPRLASLVLPDGSEYAFRYNSEHTNAACESGTLSGLTLPTGGTIEYVYRYWEIPVQRESCSGFQWKSFLTGVGTRTVSGAHVPSGTWTYASSFLRNESSYLCELNNGALILHPPPGPSEEMTVTLTDPANNVTEYFYSTWPGANWSYNGTGGYDPSLNGFTLAEYGQPFTRRVSSGGAFLSRRVYSAAGYAASPRQPLRSFYVQPDRDATACESLDSNCLQANQRMKFERTVYDDDGGATADVSYDDFDGLGHYRRMVAGGSFGSSIETITDYNKRNSGINPTTGIDSGTYPGAFAMPSPATPWILDRASKVTRTANRTQVEQQCYDETTGLLLARRALAGDSAITSNDMLALFQYAAGNLVVESYYGGDKKANAPTAAGTTLCGIVSSPPSSYEYRLTHEYTAGVRKKTQYAGVSFLALNRTIDPATGLTVSEKDVSGQKTTTYGYDTSWRSTSVAPPDDTASSIVYTNSSGTAPATVSVTAGSAQETYRYDGLGHLWRQKRLMPNGSWSLRETQHNALGWITQSSEFETIPAGVDEFAFTPSHWTVFSDFDGLGRVGKITSPAADVVTVTYVGARKTTRQQKIATSPTDQTPVSTVEEADSHGRLVKIVENDGAANAAATAYTYDVTGRLATVKWQTATESDLQPRTLTYDGRGLLTGEQHPESGTTAYLYDSRGHVTSRTTPVATLTMDYDAAERLQTVSQTGSGILKQFTYDRANTASDFSFGKLAAATRHNYVLNRDISVTETYKYEQDGGRVSSRQSSVSGYGTFSDAYAYDDYGHVTSITYPACPACAGLNAPARTVISLFTGDYLTAVQGYTSQTSPMTYDGNGLLTGIRHLDVGGTPGPLYTQTPDNGLARPQQIKVEDYCDFGLHTPLQPKSVQAGSPANLTVDAPDAATFQWYERVNGADSLLSGQTTATLTTIINSTRFFWVRAGNGDCTVDSGVVQVSATVTVNPPTNVIALATGPNAVQVTWSYSGSADSFRVERTGAPNGWAPSGSNAASPHVDPTPLANHAYLYRVIAIKNGVESVPSAPDLATTIVFDSIVPSTTVRRAQQILQLRTAANAVTALAGLPAPSFTDPDLAGRSMRLEHVTEPKAAIDQALSQLFGRPPIAYSGPPPTRGGVTRAEHLTKLQDAVK